MYSLQIINSLSSDKWVQHMYRVKKNTNNKAVTGIQATGTKKKRRDEMYVEGKGTEDGL
jgi:hypothetical protein